MACSHASQAPLYLAPLECATCQRTPAAFIGRLDADAAWHECSVCRAMCCHICIAMRAPERRHTSSTPMTGAVRSTLATSVCVAGRELVAPRSTTSIACGGKWWPWMRAGCCVCERAIVAPTWHRCAPCDRNWCTTCHTSSVVAETSSATASTDVSFPHSGQPRGEADEPVLAQRKRARDADIKNESRAGTRTHKRLTTRAVELDVVALGDGLGGDAFNSAAQSADTDVERQLLGVDDSREPPRVVASSPRRPMECMSAYLDLSPDDDGKIEASTATSDTAARSTASTTSTVDLAPATDEDKTPCGVHVLRGRDLHALHRDRDYRTFYRDCWPDWAPYIFYGGEASRAADNGYDDDDTYLFVLGASTAPRDWRATLWVGPRAARLRTWPTRPRGRKARTPGAVQYYLSHFGTAIAWQNQGYDARLLEFVLQWLRDEHARLFGARHAATMWIEVRKPADASSLAKCTLYTQHGFALCAAKDTTSLTRHSKEWVSMQLHIGGRARGGASRRVCAPLGVPETVRVD